MQFSNLITSILFHLKACQKQNVGRLVYTSTYNVVFGGQKIENGDESLPYWPLDKVGPFTVNVLFVGDVNYQRKQYLNGHGTNLMSK